MDPSHVLVVDDDRFIRLLLRRALQSAGFSVEEADGGASALRSLRRVRPSLVLLDYHMPDLDGPDVARAVRAEAGEALPIVFLTASQEEQHIREAFLAGATDYVSKPIDARLVTKRICAVLLASAAPTASLPATVGAWQVSAATSDDTRYDLIANGAEAVLCATSGPDARALASLVGARSLSEAVSVWHKRRSAVQLPSSQENIAAIRLKPGAVSVFTSGVPISLFRAGQTLLSLDGSEESPVEHERIVLPGDRLCVGSLEASLG